MPVAFGIAGLIAVGAALFAFRTVFLAVAVSLLLGILIEPVIRFFKKRLHLKHGVSVALTALLTLVLIAGMGFAAYALSIPQP